MSGGSSIVKRTFVEQVMGMPASVLLRGDDLDGVDAVVAEVYELLREVDAVFSTYREDSAVSRLRAGELAVAEAPPAVQEVLALCERAREETQGWFDVRLPGGLDPSGLVKGWAIEKAHETLCRLDEVDTCLNVGGDVAVRVGAGRPPFVVGIEDPHDRTRIIATAPLLAGGLATSGTAARGTHIVDPHTGRPVADVASLSVRGPSPMWADVYATAAFARGRDGLGWPGCRRTRGWSCTSTAASRPRTAGRDLLLTEQVDQRRDTDHPDDDADDRDRRH
jgi:thiamine biosynthesis lipoprotein